MRHPVPRCHCRLRPCCTWALLARGAGRIVLILSCVLCAVGCEAATRSSPLEATSMQTPSCDKHLSPCSGQMHSGRALMCPGPASAGLTSPSCSWQFCLGRLT